MRSLDDKVVVVTGGSAGLGRAIARAFAARRAKVAIIARGEARLEAARRELEQAGVQALSIAADVSHAGALEQAAERIEQELGPIEVWVNNAMTTIFGRLDAVKPEEIKRVTEVTYLGTVYGTMAALRRMRQRERGVIVQVGSALAYRAIPLQAAYCAAKHAVLGFTESLRCELLHDESNIVVTMVQMPGLNTPQFDWCESRMPRRAQPVGAVFQPEVGAEAVVWAALHGRRELRVGWPAIKAILADKLVPGYADRRLARIGWEGQMSNEPESPTRRGNLFEPVRADVAAHGRFDERARTQSLALWASTHRAGLYLAGSLAAGVALWLAKRAL